MKKNIEIYDEKFLKELGKNIKKLRIYKNLSQKALSEEICDRTTLSDIENGIQKTPNINIIMAICDRLEINFEYLISKSLNEIKSFSQKKQDYIIDLINFGKYQMADDFLSENIDINRSKLEYKFYYYVKGSKAFYENKFLLSLKLFNIGLDKKIKKDGQSLIEILLINGKLASIFSLNDTKIVNDSEINKTLNNQLKSISEMFNLNVEVMLKILINTADGYRCIGNIEKCNILLLEAEEKINLYGKLVLKINLNFAKIALYFDTSNIDYIPKLLKDTYQLLDIFDFKERKAMYQRKMSMIENYLFLKFKA